MMDLYLVRTDNLDLYQSDSKVPAHLRYAMMLIENYKWLSYIYCSVIYNSQDMETN